MENSSKINSNGKSDQMVEVGAMISTVCCRGTDDALGHPAVYLPFTDQKTVQCYYCGCKFKRTVSAVGKKGQ